MNQPGTSRNITRSEYHICRRARCEDLRNSAHLWKAHEPLYDPEVWRRFPGFLEELMQRELVTFALVESIPSRTPRLLGGRSFIHAGCIEEAKKSRLTLHNVVMRSALEGRKAFLSPKEVGRENARGELHSLVLFGNMDGLNLADPAVADFYRASQEGFRFFHYGYAFRAMWMEVWPSHHVQECQAMGLHMDRQVPISGGRAATLLRLTREEAIAAPYARFSGLFLPPSPRFRFSAGEQRLLEYALLDVSDDDAAEELHLSDDAVKKRWRSIYAKVEIADPNLLHSTESGAARRRSLLQYLRKHLEELRPYEDVPADGRLSARPE